LRPVPVPKRVASYHPAVRAYQSDPDRHEVSKGSLDKPVGYCKLWPPKPIAAATPPGLSASANSTGTSARLCHGSRTVSWR